VQSVQFGSVLSLQQPLDNEGSRESAVL